LLEKECGRAPEKQNNEITKSDPISNEKFFRFFPPLKKGEEGGFYGFSKD
jgi:hypothetical protein